MNAITIRNLNKSYVPGVPVLVDLDFELEKGEVHALVGSNGAGKSTLAKILTGLTLSSSGDITFADHNSESVVMVLQELNIIPTLSIAENLYIKSLPNRGGIIQSATLREKAAQALERVGLGDLEPEMPAGRLGVGQQQLIEIASALEKESSVLILDEPTAALTGPEIELLFKNIRALREQGVAILYISHRMDEIAQICDRVTVIRNGSRIATHKVSEVETGQLICEMAGSEVGNVAPIVKEGLLNEPGLTVENLCSGSVVKGVTFQAHRGEILGVAGLIGSGRTETMRAIFGADPVTSGSIYLGPEKTPFIPKNPTAATRSGIALVPEDRKNDGLLLPLSITANTVLGPGSKWLVDDKADAGKTREVCQRLAVKCDSYEQTVGELSGGNQQKIVIARHLLGDCEVFLFDEPSRGVDVAAREAIYTLLNKLAEAGKTVVVVSSDLTELMSISHRIVVMSNGRITGEFAPGEWTRENITAAAFAGYDSKTSSAA